MEEKRISLRFRMDNEQDKKAWKLLQRMAAEENSSRNAIIIRLICQGFTTETAHSLDEVAGEIAELVAERIAVKLQTSKGMTTATKVAYEDESSSSQQPQADEPEVVGSEALDFLNSF